MQEPALQFSTVWLQWMHGLLLLRPMRVRIQRTENMLLHILDWCCSHNATQLQ
jgi:hypothetical protein